MWVYFACKFLVDAGLYESQEEAVRREEVLGQIDQVRVCSLTVTNPFSFGEFRF